MSDDVDSSLAAATAAYDEARATIATYATSDAAALLERAVTLLAHDDSVAAEELRLRIAISRTWITFTDDMESTQASLEGIAEHALDLGLSRLAPLALMQQGVLWLRLGEPGRALTALRRVSAFESDLSIEDQTRLLINRGTAASLVLATSEASADFAHACDLASAAGLDSFRFMALHNRGYVEFLRGDLPAALRLMDGADRIPAQVDRGVARLDRGRVLIEAGLVGDAWDTLQSAFDGLLAAGLSPEADAAELDLARCELLLGRPGDAVARADRLARRQAACGSSYREMEARLLSLEALAFDAEPDSLIPIATALNDAVADVDPRLAEIAGALLVECQVRAGQLGTIRRDPVTALVDSTLLARRCLGRRIGAHEALACGDVSRAKRVLSAAADDIRQARSGVASLDLRTGLALHGHPLAVMDARLAVESGSPAAVIEATERWRTAVGVLPQVRAPDGADAGLWTQLRKLRADLRDASPVDIPALRGEISRTVRELKGLSWARTSRSATDLEPAGPVELSAVLDRRAVALADLVIIDDDLVCVLARPNEPMRLVCVRGATALSEAAERLNHTMEALARASASVSAASLRSGIERALLSTLDDVEAALGAAIPAGREPLLLVPPVQLAGLPWAMLPRLRGRPLTVSRSVTHWVRSSTDLARPTVAVVTGPDLATGSAEQAAVVAAWGDAQVGSTGDDFREAVASRDIVHVSAHGHHEHENPLFSSLMFADGWTFAHEVEGMPVTASHVVLSACRTGRVVVRPGDEPLGFTSCLLAFGINSVVAPLGVVGDDIASLTMAAYHRRLSQGDDAATALCEATADAPLLAGSFTCFGGPWRRSRATPPGGSSAVTG